MTQRLAVVTGAARGIGRAIVLELLKQGRKVAGLDLNAEQLAELEKVVKEAGFSVITCCLDITNTEKLTETLEKLADEHGGISILVNNAGITRDKLMIQMDDDDFDKVMNVIFGPLLPPRAWPPARCCETSSAVSLISPPSPV